MNTGVKGSPRAASRRGSRAAWIGIVWYILTEAGSIIENAGALGAKIPGFLRKAIEALNDKGEGAGDAGGNNK